MPVQWLGNWNPVVSVDLDRNLELYGTVLQIHQDGTVTVRGESGLVTVRVPQYDVKLAESVSRRVR